MIPDRDYVLAKQEVEHRRQLAAEARAAREVRRATRVSRTARLTKDETHRGAFSWLRRLAGARH